MVVVNVWLVMIVVIVRIHVLVLVIIISRRINGVSSRLYPLPPSFCLLLGSLMDKLLSFLKGQQLHRFYAGSEKGK